MAKAVFLDTVGLLGTLNKDDDLHEPAAVVLRKLEETGRSVVTTTFVLAEVGNGLARTMLRADAAWLIRTLHSDPRCTVVYVERDELFEAVELYTERNDKSWGLVDCVSFVVMRRMGLSDAFTADRHFEQAGFVALLR
jgi:predicted nucleic acid-binding protein